MSALLDGSGTLDQGHQLAGIAAAALGAVLASTASWKITDWFLARREDAR